ncbi:hypothetical protein [Porphyrobacter sp. GA68]|uniref:hypothetical protein n=1 Tax=Porphyrobacter sp. GA68 TaxID=2883480 RepID=UPI001D18A024|nr:hypothetical protein [Porphyrobacter sp. GA68]
MKTCVEPPMDDADLTDAQTVALNYAAPAARPVYRSLFAFETRLGRMVAGAREPALVQIRMAWWREQLQGLDDRPHSDPLLRLLTQSGWAARSRDLVEMVDGWEALLFYRENATTLPDSIRARTAGYAAAARLLGMEADGAAVAEGARWWVAADALHHLRAGGDDASVQDLTQGWPIRLPRLPRQLRPVSVLAALGQRSLLRGGQPPLSRRGDALAALRVGLVGR